MTKAEKTPKPKRQAKAAKPVHQVLVVGGGLSGLCAALAAGKAGLSVGLIRPKVTKDARTTALMVGAVKMMEALGVWQKLAARAAPLESLKIVDMTGRLVRAPTAHFIAREIGLDAFAYNIDNESLLAALEKAIKTEENIKVYTAEAGDIQVHDDCTEVALSRGGPAKGQLLLAADGRRSHVREQIGIELDEKPYPQVALAFHLEHPGKHDHCSVEFHTPPGPCTFVPMPGNRSAVVWVMTPEENQRRAALSPEALVEELHQMTRGYLHGAKIFSPIGRFPLANASARRLSDKRIILIGESAHVLPPIGAQGLNLGLRDIAVLMEILTEERVSDSGERYVTDCYAERRKLDLATRRMAADLLNRSLISDLLPAQLARGIGMNLLNTFAPLRRFVMREGLSPQRETTSLFNGKLPKARA